MALKFLYFLTVLNLNSNLFYQCFLLVLFTCKDPSPLYKLSKRRNHPKPENLETLFLLSTLKVPIKENSQKPNCPLIFRFSNCIFIFQHLCVFLFHCWK